MVLLMSSPWIQKIILILNPDDLSGTIDSISTAYCEEHCQKVNHGAQKCSMRCDTCKSPDACYHCLGGRTTITEKYYQMIEDTFGTIPTRSDYNVHKEQVKKIKELNSAFGHE
jgi:hypothetical protein